ncbi:MAG TPA: hypothetical protein VM532_01080 [Burkholderiales bacterium]|nr:hypothetical protein [Burkholderiales bacterium]
MKNAEQAKPRDEFGTFSATPGVNEGPYAQQATHVASAFDKIVTDGEELLKATANYSAEGLVIARDRLQAAIEQAKVGMHELRGVVQEKANRATAATEEYVITNPWRALLIAGSAGLIIGFLLRRR